MVRYNPMGTITKCHWNYTIEEELQMLEEYKEGLKNE